jgi:hypothetical protein
MNVLSGLQLQGLVLNTEENYNSIPGLMQWNDSRERLNFDTNGRVSYWGDKSAQNNHFTRNSTNTRPEYENNLWVTSRDTARYLMSPRKDYTFLHNGSKFGLYYISKIDWSLTTASGTFGPLFFAGAAGTGLQGILNSATNTGRFGYAVRNAAAGTQSTRQITNLLNTSNANYTPPNTVITHSFVNFGQLQGIVIRFGNAQLTTTPFFPTLAEYPQAPNSTFTAVTGSSTVGMNSGLILIYNWTDYTDAQVTVFDQRVRALLDIDRMKFQLLDTP